MPLRIHLFYSNECSYLSLGDGDMLCYQRRGMHYCVGHFVGGGVVFVCERAAGWEMS
jgi:hypothetical protein